MSGIEEFITNKNEFKENYEGLKNEPNLISFDGPDGTGKTEISKRVLEKLKDKFKSEGKNPDDIIYFKFASIADTKSQTNIKEQIKECIDVNGNWDKSKINHMLKLWSAKLNRSYSDHIIPLLKDGKTVILDRSEVDVFRAGIEWGDKELLDTITKYMEDGTLTHGTTSGNRIFITCPAEDIYKNLNERPQLLSPNDPKSLDEIINRITTENQAEELISEINKKERPNIIKIENKRFENTEEKNVHQEMIAEKILNELKL